MPQALMGLGRAEAKPRRSARVAMTARVVSQSLLRFIAGPSYFKARDGEIGALRSDRVYQMAAGGCEVIVEAALVADGSDIQQVVRTHQVETVAAVDAGDIVNESRENAGDKA